MYRTLPLLFLLTACAGDPLDVTEVTIPTKRVDDGLTELAYEADGPLTGSKELLSAHDDLTLKFSFRADADAKAVLNLQGRYPITLPNVGVAGGKSLISAEVATDIWHELELVFKAPTESTPPLLPAVYLDGNLIYFQQELATVTEPAGPLSLDVTSGSVELADLRQSPTAGRGSMITAEGEVDLNIPLLRYEYYEVEPGTKDIKNWAQLTPEKTGFINRMDLATIREQNSNYAVRFFGALDVPRDGEYKFRVFSPTTARLIIDGNTIVEVLGNPTSRQEFGELKLAEGKHEIRAEYIQRGGWNAFDIAYQADGADERTLNSMGGNKAIARPNIKSPLKIETDDEPYLLRSFMFFPAPKVYEVSEKRTHVVSVGEGEGPYYSVDLQTGALLQVWRGDFADVQDMWNGRGEAQVMRPLGPALAFDGSPQWAHSASKPWPAPAAAPEDDDFTHLAYELDADGRPTFNYDFGNSLVSDQIVPDGKGLVREIMNVGENVFTQIASGSAITEIAPGEFELRGPGVRIKIEAYDGPGLTVQRGDGVARLIAEVPDQGAVRYRIDW